MRTFAGHESVGDEVAGAVIAIGNFDGLHRGHQALFEQARERARERSVQAGVLTFEPHPVKVLAPHLAPPLILTAAEKEAGIAALGLDFLVVEPFTEAFAGLTPRAFVDDVLVAGLQVGGVVVGADFSFGHKAQGRTADLMDMLGLDRRSVDVVEAVREGELVCSSSKIRQFVLEGRVDAAGLLLGRPYSVRGDVVRGDGRGRQIGVPTANLQCARELLPKVGVYATRAVLADGSDVASVTNVGLRPTFQGEGVRIEAHLLDFDRDLYGQSVDLRFLERLRDERRFPSIEALKEQIAADIVAARMALGPAR